MRSSIPYLLFFVFLCVSAPLRFNAKAAEAREGEIRGVWIHTYAPFDWDAQMKKLADAGFNCVFVRVARGANAIYSSQYLPRDDWAEQQVEDELLKAINAAHQNGLEFHAWKVCFHVGGAAKQKGAAKVLYDQMAEQDRLVRGLDGQQAPFLNPADPRNQELELNVLRELVEKYDIDGIHLDYIRYPDAPHFDFDYGAVSRREFEKQIGRSVVNWPQDVYSGVLKWDYENWERGNINRLVQRVYTQTKKLKPRVQVSAAVWRAHRKYRAAIKQDWPLWVKNNWLDFVVPMDYTTDDEQFRSDVRAQLANTAGRILLASGIGAYQHKVPDDTLRQIQIAREEGADGYVLFDYKPDKYDALLEALKNSVHNQSTRPAFRAPRLEWLMTQGLVRKDDVPVFSVGKAVAMIATFSDRGDDPEVYAINLKAELRRMDAGGARVIQAEPDEQDHKLNRIPWRFVAPSGRWRIVLRGEASPDEKTLVSFEIHGPIFEGTTANQIAAIRAKEKPPRVMGTGQRIAVYSGGMAASGFLKVLQAAPDLNVYPIYRLEAAHWQQAQVLILPQLNDVAELSPDVVKSLREWVEQGGVLILTHDAAGFRWHLRAFPEVGQGIELSKQRRIEVLPNNLDLTTGVWQHEYSDHVVLQAGAQGRVLAREAKEEKSDAPDKPVLIAGRFGKGMVILSGMLLGYMPTGTMNEAERRLLIELVNLK